MKPDTKSNRLLGVTRAKAKMIEYHVPQEYQEICSSLHPNKLFTIAIGLLGDLAAAINREKIDSDSLLELKTHLLFSARFFDSYLQAKLNETLDPYLVILGAASYYLCDLPGSALVLARRIDGDYPDLEGAGLEKLLLWLLRADLKAHFDGVEEGFGRVIDGISQGVRLFFQNGTGEEALLSLVMKLRNDVYAFGTPRQLLFGDVIAAVLRKKLENSVWKALPSYSGLPREKWFHVLQKDSFIKELWPAQHLLGQANVLKGESAIVQMPTSAGKTKATELILRSAFLSGRISLAIILAPFRALCHEIKNTLIEAFWNEDTKVNELSDALQTDFEIAELLEHQQVLVVTPEKLLYVLRQAPDLATHIGLLVFDEGHQFDDANRGITYELLLASLRSTIPEGAQKVLISAVISNAEIVGEWLNGTPNVIEGTTLIPTFRSVGFVSWLEQLGKIAYVNSRNAEQEDFFVPRVIQRCNLRRKKREKKDRFFPEEKKSKDIALYLGLKLIPNGGIAIFCGRKSTAISICKRAVDIIERQALLPLPLEFSDAQEVARLKLLHVENLGVEAPSSKSAAHGIFFHHGNMPHGIRLAVEYAMRNDLVRFVVCTSTLAQGVNLPIRYIIVNSVNQDKERIKVRDFHNLIGRAGRAGMHTEGSILFADPRIYDGRKASDGKRSWDSVKELLDPRKSEPCGSNLLAIFEPIRSDDERTLIRMEPLDFVKGYINEPDKIPLLADQIVEMWGNRKFSRVGVKQQISWRMNLICAVESFLLSHWDESESGLSEDVVIRLAKGTLAFFLANDQQKKYICELFILLAKNIAKKVTDPMRRKIYGRTLYGVRDAQAIEKWVQANVANLLSIVNETDVINLIWPLLIQQINYGIFTKFDQSDVLKTIAHGWICGKSFCALQKVFCERKVKMRWGTKRTDCKIDNVVNLCEGALAYDGVLIVSAVCEFIEILNQDGAKESLRRLQLFQKRLKYGLPTETTVALYELGFSDRVVAQDLAASLKLEATRKNDLVKVLKQDQGRANEVMEKYPSYFRHRMNELLK